MTVTGTERRTTDRVGSHAMLVRILHAFRARAIAEKHRPIATAEYRAVNLTAVSAGLAVGGIAGLVLALTNVIRRSAGSCCFLLR